MMPCPECGSEVQPYVELDANMRKVRKCAECKTAFEAIPEPPKTPMAPFPRVELSNTEQLIERMRDRLAIVRESLASLEKLREEELLLQRIIDAAEGT